MTPVGSARATAAPTFHAIALTHLDLRRASRRRGHGFESVFIVQTRVGVRVEELVFRVVAVDSFLNCKQACLVKGEKDHTPQRRDRRGPRPLHPRPPRQ